MDEIEWTAPEFERRPKSVSWYWGSIVVAIIIIGAAIWQKNFLFGFFVVLAEVLILVWGNQEPRTIEFSVNNQEITIGGNKNYSYKELVGFSVGDGSGEEWDNLFLQFKSRARPMLRIKVPRGEVGKIKQLLSSSLQEMEHEPSLLDSLEEFIGF